MRPHSTGRSSARSGRSRVGIAAAGAFLLAVTVLGTVAAGSPSKAGAQRVTYTRGRPWTGPSARTETVSHLMARARRTPPSVREFGRLPEAVRPPKKTNPAALPGCVAARLAQHNEAN